MNLKYRASAAVLSGNSADILNRIETEYRVSFNQLQTCTEMTPNHKKDEHVAWHWCSHLTAVADVVALPLKAIVL